MTIVWAGVLMTALLWPSHVLSPLDGMPLDGPVEAIVIGLAVPVLVWLHGRFLTKRAVRLLVVALLLIKIADNTLLTQQGLCAGVSALPPGPYSTEVLTIPIDEPNGVLRSWDVRADMHAETPACTAIVDRPYLNASAFPAWFVNITDFASAGKRAFTLALSGYVRVTERGLFVVDVDRGMDVSGRIGSQDVASTGGKPMLAALDSGTQRIDLRATMTGEAWRLVPTWNGRSAFSTTTMTAYEPRRGDALAGLFRAVEGGLIVALVAAWIASLLYEYRDNPALVVWCVAASAVLALLGASARFERFAVLLLVAAALVPVSASHRHLRGVMLLVGVPWLVLIAAPALSQVGHFTAYSNDDWLAYQVAGYRIFMHGNWLEGGSKVFDYQPLYRWMSGALHVVFGDSSVGERYWDAVCLLLGASVTFVLVDRVAGFRWGVAAAAATLSTFWLGTIWYFVGRGLSEIAAAGWAFIAALLLLSRRAGRPAYAVLAGAFATLMFYTRLNHLLFAVFLLALTIPVLVPARWDTAMSAIADRTSIDRRGAALYLATFAVGVALFAARTWWYTGVFSVLYGTSLKNNDTGLRLTTMFDASVWSRVWHGLRALAWMNEPPSPDPRAILVAVGLLLSVAALLQMPRVNRLPLSIAIVSVGACVSTLFAHTHNYPGRMSIHLVPFAVAMTATAGARLLGR
jgi:hypothetical protein